MDRAQGLGRLPSVVGARVEEGRVVLRAGAGAHGDLDAQYRIGSITKTLTAVLVLQCQQDGLLALEDRVRDHLPEAGYGDARLRDLLAHTAGLQAEPVGDWWERSPGVDVPTLLERNDGSGRVFAAGEAFHYSNLGFALLGEVAARLRGRTWWELVQERLLEPLGMTRTSYHPQVPNAQGYSVGHFTGTLTEEPHADTGAMAPAGQLWSTVDDLARWLDFLATGHPEVLGADALAGMCIPGAPGIDYGLGLRLLDGLVGHTGSMPGFLATAFVDRATRRGVVGFANATTGLVTDQFACDLRDGVDRNDTPLWEPSVSVPPEVAEVLGIWFWGNSAHAVRWHNGRLELRDLNDPEDLGVFTDGAGVHGRAGSWRGTEGYLLGETLQVRRDGSGQAVELECATFRFTRTPYPDAP
ncbi:serine hydrolase domain-containing protein [Nocardioides marmorisolisilvae]|uniref:serine hydrolase domain-containing protein n=1 Tax=Nocardioides marmorisolisilvae TaxID=1542737 RepID=UPI00160FA20B|nr:serine hydrolase domain-containing protein [Nocardioides marmorisolisilvae]